LMCSVWLELPLSRNMHILLSFIFCMNNRKLFFLDLVCSQIQTWSWAGFWICCGH
jgi:hypothetical protein